MCKPFGDSCANPVLLSEPWFDKPRCPCPCLACDTILQKRSKPLLRERLPFSSNLILIYECFLTLSFVKITKIPCKRFPLEAAIWPSQLREFGLFTDEASETVFTKCDCDNFTWVEIPLELLGSLVSNLLGMNIRNEVAPRRYNQLMRHG